MKKWLLITGCVLTAMIGRGQVKEVLLKQQALVIRYMLDSTETSQAVYNRFGMTDSQFLQLNKVDSVRPNPYLYVTISAHLKPACETAQCVYVFYETQPGDDYGKLARLFGYADPYELKAMNADVESMPAGTVLHVGHLPAHLFAPGQLTGAAANALVKTATSQRSLYRGQGVYQADFATRKTWLQTAKTGPLKSLSGWYDGKFYMLSADVPTGTVLKVTNPANGQQVFAKVLGPLPTIKGEKLPKARLNTAALAALGIWDEQEHELLFED